MADLKLQITSKERILLHLKDFQAGPSDFYFPEETTQKGIGESTCIMMSHVPRTIKSLIKEGLVEERKGRIRSSPRRLKVYLITSMGAKAAEEITERIASNTIIAGGTEIKVADLYAKEKKKGFWEFLRVLVTGGEAAARSMISEAEISFFGRRKEVALIKKFIRSGPGDALVIYGSRGCGKTSMIRSVISAVGCRCVWVEVDPKMKVLEFVNKVVESASIPSPASADALCASLSKRVDLIVIDGYDEIRDDLCDYISQVSMELRDSKLRMIVCAQVTTPSYSRFFHRDDVNCGRVVELMLPGLEPEEAKRILDPISQQKFDMINKFAKGNPLILSLIKTKDVKSLQAVTKFTREEIRHIIYLYESD
jgi:DNA-binding MarR family transcriptional regulator